MNLDIFRAYDVRGIFGVDFEPKDFYRIACAYTDCFQPKTVAVGHDVRERSPELWRQVASGFQDSGVDILDLGRISTDMLYFAMVHYGADGGIVITASHNPAVYNGMKLVGRHATPVSADTGLFDVRDAVKNGNPAFEKQKGKNSGTCKSMQFLDAYLSHLRSFVNGQRLSGRRIVINANGGLAGQISERLLADTPIQVCQRLFTEPDGSFAEIPGGRPDPLRPENRELTTAAVRQTGADLAVAWDADADRCFFFDDTGAFVEGCYITALLAEKFLRQRSGGVIFDPRAVWAVEHAVVSNKGRPILSRCGHSFIKAGMRESQALFAGEASGHYYFRDNFYADNGMIPFLLVLEYLSVNGMSLAEVADPLRAAYPVSGEINFSFETDCQMRDALAAVNASINCWGDPRVEAPIDGLSVGFLSGAGAPERGSWRFNLRESNTEPLLRLNVETVGDAELLIEKTMQISEKLESIGGRRETKFRWETEKFAKKT